jgi:purine-binding chemotaxis protein CheW
MTEMHEDHTHIQTIKYLTFSFGEENYAIDLSNIQEIQSYKSLGCIGKISNVPMYLKGIVHLHDAIIPIVDMRILYGLAPNQDEDYCVIIILNIQEKLIGIVVDAVSEIVDLTADQIKTPPDFFALMEHSYVEGIANYNDHILIILDLRNLLVSEQLQIVV